MKISFSDTIFEKSNTDGISPDVKIAFTNAILERNNIRTADLVDDMSDEYVKILREKGIEEANKYFDKNIKTLSSADKKRIDVEIAKKTKISPVDTDNSSKERSGVTTLVDKMKEISNRPGGAEQLAKVQEQRYRTVKNLESLIPSATISKYLGVLLGDRSFDESNPEQVPGVGGKSLNLPEEVAYGLLFESANAARSTGQPVEDIIDFSIEYFDKVQSIELLGDILSTASEVAKTNRSIPLFKMLKDSAVGQTTTVEQYVSAFETYDQYILFSALISQIQSGPVEDQEQARRNWQKSKNLVSRAIEKYNRKISYVDMLKSTGVNNKLKEVITGLGKTYNTLLQYNLFQGFLDTFYSLEAAQVARGVFMSGVTRGKVEVPSGQEPRNFVGPPSTGANINNRTILAQEKQEAVPKENMFADMASVLSQFAESLEASIPGIKLILNQVVQRLLNLSANASDEEVNKVFDIKSYNIPGMQSQTSNTAPTSNREVQSFRLNSNLRLAGGRPKSRFVQFFSSGLSAFIKNANLFAMKDLFQVVALLFVFFRNVFNEYRANKKFELDDDFFDENGKLKNSQTLTNYRDVLSKIRVNNNMIQAVLTAMQVRTRIKNKLNDFEDEINRVVEIEVQTGATSGSTNAPLKNESQLRKIYDQYIVELRGAISLFNQELALHKQIMQLANGAALDPINLNLISEKYRSCSADIQVIKNKLGKYSSFALIIENIARRSRFNRRLKLVLAKAKKFQAIGLSTADIVTDPNGLLPILKQIRDNEVQGLEKLKKELVNRTTAGNSSDIYLR
jgi:hypothetical protein